MLGIEPTSRTAASALNCEAISHECLSVCMSTMCFQELSDFRKGSLDPLDLFTSSHELPHECWELNLGLLQEQ